MDMDGCKNIVPFEVNIDMRWHGGPCFDCIALHAAQSIQSRSRPSLIFASEFPGDLMRPTLCLCKKLMKSYPSSPGVRSELVI